jgi:hypothetical protein
VDKAGGGLIHASLGPTNVQDTSQIIHQRNALFLLYILYSSNPTHVSAFIVKLHFANNIKKKSRIFILDSFGLYSHLLTEGSILDPCHEIWK